MRNRFLFLLALAVVAPVAGQDGGNPFWLKQSVTVTATRSEVDTLEAAAPATVVTGEEIRIRNVQVLDQALDATVGVYANRGKGFQDTQAGVGMRGFAGRGSGQARVLVLIDGQPVNDGYTGQLTWAVIPVEEVERVEVVRGAFSALYGGNAMGGVINVLTKPVEGRRGEVYGQLGSQETFRYGARVAERWRQRLGVSGAYERMQSGGYQSQLVSSAGVVGTGGTPVTGYVPAVTTGGALTFLLGDAGKNWWQQEAWRVRGDYTVGSKTTAFVQYLRQGWGYGYDAYRSYLRTETGGVFDSGVAGIVHNGVARRLTVSPSQFLPGDGGGKSNLVAGKLHHGFASGWRMRVGGGWLDMPRNYFTTPGAGATLAGGGGTVSDRPARSWFGETQWNKEWGGRQEMTGGWEMRRDEAAIGEYVVPNYARQWEGQSLSHEAGGKSMNHGAYGQHQWRLTERLQWVGGVRYDWWRTFAGRFATPGTTLNARLAARANQMVSAKGAALYRAPGGIVLRGSVGNAFRNPTVFDLYRTWRSAAGTVFAANPGLERERLVAWEAGAARRWTGGWEVDGVFFVNEVRDLIYRGTDFTVDPRGLYRPLLNAAAARTRGVEASARMPLGRWLWLRSNYTWNEAVIRRNPVLPETVGKRVPQVPWHNASFALLGAGRRVSGSVAGRYVSRVYATDTNTDVVKGVYGAYDPFFEMDASVRVEVQQHVVLEWSAENVLNRIYYNFFRAPGRMVYGGLRLRW
jgi:iron complex outermembrane receptor protein